MYDLSKTFGFKYYVDYSLHPVSKFLIKPNHPHEQLVYKNRDNIPFIGYGQDIQQTTHILNHKFNKEDILFGFTNISSGLYHVQNDPISDDCKMFMKKILRPNDILQKHINEYLLKLPKQFEVLHYRLGDMTSLVSKKLELDIDKLEKHILERMNSNTLFVSDSKVAKDIIYKKLYDKVFMFHHDIGHIGFHKEEQKILNTLVELFVLSKATRIRSFSIYSWPSGYTNAVHKIFDVPLEAEVNCTYFIKNQDIIQNEPNWWTTKHTIN
jgi:hypothetical protein